MSVATSMVLETSLQQKLSAQMIQNLQLAAMPLAELQQKVSDAILTNPVLEMHTQSEGSDLSGSDDSAYDKDESDKRDDPSSWEQYDHAQPDGYDEEASDRAMAALENSPGVGESLQDHLLSQLRLEKLDERQMQAGELLASNLDGNGFWSRNPDEILPSYLASVKEQVLPILQGLDPVGCFVPSWRESLVVQGKDRKLKPEEVALLDKLVHSDNALQLMASGKVEAAASQLDCDKGDLAAIFAFMKTLTLYPGRSYSEEFSDAITPDLSVHAKDGSLLLDVNDEAIPTLTLDPQYLEMEKTTKDQKAKSYLSGQIREAKVLISQIDFRHTNLERMGRRLCSLQQEFFFKGTKYLKPLSQKQLADDMEVSEGTVSRLVSNKYIETDWGILPLKSLFVSGVDGASKNSVQEMIREILQNAAGKKKLSDQKISDLLAGKGVKVARRTVAKYRAQMGLDSSFER